MTKVFIDGKAGTTGLRIYERLADRADIEVVTLSEELRKDVSARRDALNGADVAFLCLPDDAARQAVALVENESTVVIDASTAHRTEKGWAYGFPELGSEFAAAIKYSRRIAVPGCHASGFVALVRPLVAAGILPASAKLVCNSLTGYSGGGKSMIADYNSSEGALCAPRQYALGQTHKHLKEMVHVTGLSHAPVFCPVVADFYSGMEVTVGLFAEDLCNGATASDVKACLSETYNCKTVFFKDACDESGFLSAGAYTGKDGMEISVWGNNDRILLVARYDNLGKGASGAAVQCMNTALGLPPETGLVL